MDTLKSAVAFFEDFLTHAHLVSILIGLLLAIGFTQWAKYPLRRLADDRGWQIATFKFLTRTTALLAGTAGTWLTWPQAGKFAVLWGLVTGFCSPLVYTGAVRALGHFWPWLADKASTDA